MHLASLRSPWPYATSVTQAYVPAANCVSDQLDLDVVVVNISTGALHILTAEASDAWRACVIDGGEPRDARQRSVLAGLIAAGILQGPGHADTFEIPVEELYVSYADMEDLMLIDPIHDVEAGGWPVLREQQ